MIANRASDSESLKSRPLTISSLYTVNRCSVSRGMGSRWSNDLRQATNEYAPRPIPNRQEGDVISPMRNVLYGNNEVGFPNVGGVSSRSRNGAPFRKGCVVDGQMTKANNS